MRPHQPLTTKDHILQVEDDRDTRLMLAATLREEGYAVTVADRGANTDRADGSVAGRGSVSRPA
jgi:CheY-like chemotaxis protein